MEGFYEADELPTKWQVYTMELLPPHILIALVINYNCCHEPFLLSIIVVLIIISIVLTINIAIISTTVMNCSYHIARLKGRRPAAVFFKRPAQQIGHKGSSRWRVQKRGVCGRAARPLGGSKK